MHEIDARIRNVLQSQFTPNSDVSVDEFEDALSEIYQSFGNCFLCYGKGYSTEWKGLSGMGDFHDKDGFEESPKMHINFCGCERGLQLQQVLKSNYGS
jgi:hypothetical protein